MENKTSYADQLAWCIQTAAYLNDLERNLRDCVNQVSHTMNVLEGALVEEQMKNIAPFSDIFEVEATKTYKMLQVENLAYVRSKSAEIQEEIERLSADGARWVQD